MGEVEGDLEVALGASRQPGRPGPQATGAQARLPCAHGPDLPWVKPLSERSSWSLDSWRSNRDENGFRLLEDKKRSRGENDFEEGKTDSSSNKKQRCHGNEKAFLMESQEETDATSQSGWGPGPKRVEQPVPMLSDPEYPISWEEKFGNFNLAQFGDTELAEPPKRLRPTMRLKFDILAMMELTSSEEGPRRLARPAKLAHAIYGFGDASKEGFGVSIEIQGRGVVWRSGTWSKSMRKESSNYREFRNLVEMIETLVENGTLRGHELVLFTDNSTAELTFFKGTLSSEKLFNLVLRLRKIEMSGDLFLHLIHVSGTRMIWSGVDGLSRGDHNAGVMAGDDMLSFVPLSQNAAERSSPQLLPWNKS
jgi:hypothetical protein